LDKLAANLYICLIKPYQSTHFGLD
jgi:hypothetical protein